jgi:hypothetical protein
MTSADFKKAAAPHPDGFGGTRDASILATYDREGDFVFVQSTSFTDDLIKRAGIKRPRRHAFYKLPVRECEKIRGLQLNGEASAV